jgi:hypothetical protein
MFLLLLRVAIVFGLLSAIYVGLVAYMRWDRRKQLEEEHAAGAAPALSREDYVAKGLAEYERSWSRKALYGIFLLPVAIGTILGILATLT